jgi:hypothetical protein
VITYYRSRFLSPPIVYVQQDDVWKSYAPAGVDKRCRNHRATSAISSMHTECSIG